MKFDQLPKKENSKREKIHQLVGIIGSFNLRKDPIIIHTSQEVKDMMSEFLEINNVEIPEGVIESDRFNDELHQKNISSDGELATIYQTSISPGEEGYFWTKYKILDDGTTLVGYETTEDSQEYLFKKFTGKIAPFSVETSKIVGMIRNDISTGNRLKQEAADLGGCSIDELPNFSQFTSILKN
jgi:hypothetical protein